MSDDRATQAEQLITRMKAARGYIYPEWELAARTDPDFTDAYNRLLSRPWARGGRLRVGRSWRSGHRLSWHTLDEECSVGKPYIVKHDREVLRTFEQAGNIPTKPPTKRRPKRTGEVSLNERPPWHGTGSLAREK
jgi:hypothetical protein